VIEIVEYTDRWASEFMSIGRTIRQALGSHALRIDHIGSTSVPGLAAKNVIDIQITVQQLVPFDQTRQALETLGYVLRPEITRDHCPPGFEGSADEWAKRYFREPDGQRRVHVHVREAGRANQRYALLFRDYLRSHSGSAAGYAEVKRQLAHYHPDDISAYVTIKDPVCDIIWFAAESWARTTNWYMEASDI
jgi:GrpB-like predicted nucleotidyltransferase (UPF0157 family)